MIKQYLPWLLSVITIWMTVLAGNKHPKAWLVGIVNQLLWLIWIVASASWGLIPMNIALWIVYARNHFKWAMKCECRPANDYSNEMVICKKCRGGVADF